MDSDLKSVAMVKIRSPFWPNLVSNPNTTAIQIHTFTSELVYAFNENSLDFILFSFRGLLKLPGIAEDIVASISFP